jgi:SagB-type dehydrogenase family enzyme
MEKESNVELPQPRTKSTTSLEETLSQRRSIRSYAKESLTLGELAQLLWAAQGSTGPHGLRTAPSAGATYPLETYAVVGQVEGLEPGLYHYAPESHSLSIVKRGDIRAELSEAALRQSQVANAPVSLLIAAVYDRTTGTYGDRGQIYVHMDVGHAAQNVLLQATALGLGSVPIGAFRTRTVAALLGLPEGELPLYILPVGRPV